jgi:glycine/D-amino acid oxidase-like deaminating enzyme
MILSRVGYMSVSIWHKATDSTEPVNSEVAVIGAGIVGAYTARTLAEAGKKVCVLEARFPAAGATGRNAGFCLMGAADNYATGITRYGRAKARALWELTRENQRHMRELVKKFNIWHEECGSAILAIDAPESVLLDEAYELMREDGFNISFSREDPFGRGFGSAIFQPDDFGLHPVNLTLALLDHPGITLHAPAEVYAVYGNTGRLVVLSKQVSVLCDQLALCTNAYSPLISSYFRDKIAPKRGQILVTPPLKKRVVDRLVYTNYGYEYFRQLPDGQFLLGGGRGHHKELEVGYDETPTEWVQNTLDNFMRQFFSDVLAETGGQVTRRWAGIMGFSVDGLPLVGRLPHVPGHFPALSQSPIADFHPADFTPDPSPPEIWFAAGMTGHGNGWGLAAADLMIGQMLGQRQDGGLFDVARLN